MTEHQKKLLKDYGPRFVDRSGNIMNEFLHLAADACSVLTDAEWKNCAESITKTVDELGKVRNIVAKRLEEVAEEDEKTFEEIMDQAFSKDPEEAFQGSIKLARLSGVPEDEILKSQEDIDRFFLGE